MGAKRPAAPCWLVSELLAELQELEASYARSISLILDRPFANGGKGRLVVRAYWRDAIAGAQYHGVPGAVIDLPSRSFQDIGTALVAAARECRDATPIAGGDWGRFTEIAPGWLESRLSTK